MINSRAYIKIKSEVCTFLEPHSYDKGIKKIGDYFMVSLVLLNTLAVILETVSSFDEEYGEYLYIFEIFSIAIFTIEYLLRIWSITANPLYKNSIVGRLRYIFRPTALIDLFAILPFYAYTILPFDLRFLRLFRLFRFIRLAKIGRYSNSLKILGNVFRAKKEELIMTLYIIGFVIIISACFVYMAEHETQPDKFSSIPQSIYWIIVSLTTIGNGSVFPITFIGRLFTILIALVGIGVFAIPTGILASGFYEVVHPKNRKCPHCGENID